MRVEDNTPPRIVLTVRRRQLRERRRWIEMSRAAVVLFACVLLLGVAGLLVTPGDQTIGIALGIYGLALLACGSLLRRAARRLTDEISDVNLEIGLLDLFQRHERQLKKLPGSERPI
jgi:drug/metabolite transporter (DMT)-like permease